MRDAFWSIIYKICEFQPFWMIFWKFCNKISLFLAIFLEFFGLRNNLTLQEPLYTRNISPILYTERNKKNHFSNKFNLQVCKLNLARQTQTKQVFGKSTWTCEQHYLCSLKSNVRSVVLASVRSSWKVASKYKWLSS